MRIEELSEEDQNLKNELEMLVARLHVCLAMVSTRIHTDAWNFYRNPIPASTYLRWMLSKTL